VSTDWLGRVTPAFVDDRFGEAVVNAALGRARIYSEAPHLDPSGRMVATVIDTPGPGPRLSTPFRVAIRLQDKVIDFTCSCRASRLCEHTQWLFVDVAFGAHEDPELRAIALESRTLDDRIAAWLPSKAFDDADFEIDVEPTMLNDRAAVLLRHRKKGSTKILAAKDVLNLRLSARRRSLVDLTAPHHADKLALVATKGQAALAVQLLRDEIGAFAHSFKTRLRFAREPVRPRIQRDADRLVVVWRTPEGAIAGEASATILFAGAFPWLWSGAERGFFPVAPDVDLDAAMGMQRVPSLPLDREERVGRAILSRAAGLGVDLPTPTELGLPPLERPTFELRLSGTPLDLRGDLTAVYRAGTFRVGPEPSPDRDANAEAEAIGLANAAGLDFEDGLLVAREESAVQLWASGIASLRASGFEVFIADSIAGTRVGPPVSVEVSVGSAAGWLETELEYRAGALKIEVARMHDALVRSKRWLVLDDGTLTRIADDVAVLLGDRALAKPKLRLESHQIGRFDLWESLASANINVHIDPKTRALASVPAEPKLPAGLTAELRPYQRSALAWLQHLQAIGAGGLLADDMGLGKTLTTLAFLARAKEESGPTPALIVCPTSMIGTWAREAERFVPDLRVSFGRAKRGEDRDTDLLVLSYGVVRREAEKLRKTRFRAIVLDEAHNIKNAGSETARAVRRLDAELRLALTGTPVENRLGELWSIMTFANPGMLGTAKDFEERYAIPISHVPDGLVAKELRAVVAPFILRRTKAQVLTDLPPKTEITRECVFGVRQRKLYDALSIALHEAIGERERRRKDARTRLSVLTAMLRLRQLVCDPRLVDPSVSADDSAKRLAFLDVVRELVSEDRRALVFSQFVELLTLWREDLDRLGIAYEYLDGSTTDRDRAVDRFQNGRAPLFLISLKAGGAGLNLTAADTVILCDPWWNPAAEAQAMDRAHRPGQSRPVTVVRLVAEGTIEDKLGMLKQTKRDLAEAVLEPDD
jgi:superfamily II DNA or RNA helicase